MPRSIVTWTCGHFCIGTSKEDVVQNFAARIVSADSDLLGLPTHRHVKSSIHCPNCLKTPLSQAELKVRCATAIRHLVASFDIGQNSYFMYGVNFHTIEFIQQARFVNHPRCALAFEQFAISSTPQDEDEFFTNFRRLQRLTKLAVALSDSNAFLHAFVHINDARAAAGRILGSTEELRKALDMMEDRNEGEKLPRARAVEIIAKNFHSDRFFNRLNADLKETGWAALG